MKFYITFGQKYGAETHPHGDHPDGWLYVEAESQGEAREKVLAAIRQTWAFSCAECGFDLSRFPPKIGEIE